MEVHDQLFEVELENSNKKEPKKNESRRCKWWNRGYCCEKEGCTYAHPKEDCQNHLKDGCTIKGCKNLRHRKKCKYFKTDTGCHRGESCEYLHILDDINRINEAEGKNTSEKEVQTENKSEVKDKDIQTEIEEKCLCKNEVLKIRFTLNMIRLCVS